MDYDLIMICCLIFILIFPFQPHQRASLFPHHKTAHSCHENYEEQGETEKLKKKTSRSSDFHFLADSADSPYSLFSHLSESQSDSN